LLPAIIPRLTAVARRLTGRDLDLGVLPPRAVYIAIGGNIIAWLMYGWSFQLLVHGVLGRTPGHFSDYVAAYALSYIMGYLAFFIPGGLGAREISLAFTLGTLNLANPKEAAVIAIVSRLWLTVLEVIPGLLYLAAGTRPATQAPTPPNGSNS
jgi:uncharacterized membrane protein YbhN (UPF0104 family)